MDTIKIYLHFLFKQIVLSFRGTGVGRLQLVGRLYRYFLRLLSPRKVKIDGFTIFLDKGDSLGLSIFGVHNQALTNVILDKTRKKDVVVDVGAHIGYYTLMFSKLVGNDGVVFAFEPSKENFAILRKNVECNKLANVVLENLAVVDENKKKVGFSIFNDSQVGQIVNHKKRKIDYFVEAVSLDDYFGGRLRNIDLVKIDVEGAECKVLRGMKKILNRNKEIKLIIEFCPSHLKDFDCPSEEFLGLLVDYNFVLCDVGHKGRVVRKSVERLLEEYPLDRDSKITNLLCLR